MNTNNNFNVVILAAGLSSRSKQYKLSLNIKGLPLISHCVNIYKDICSKIIIVCGHNIEIIKDIVGNTNKVEIVFNENYMDGMFSSVKEGIKYVTSKKFFLTPGDIPFVNKNTLIALSTEQDPIVIPSFSNKKGHPVLISSDLISQIISTSDLNSLKDFINLKGYKILDVDDAGILFDVDTMYDFENLNNIILKGGSLNDWYSNNKK